MMATEAFTALCSKPVLHEWNMRPTLSSAPQHRQAGAHPQRWTGLSTLHRAQLLPQPLPGVLLLGVAAEPWQGLRADSLPHLQLTSQAREARCKGLSQAVILSRLICVQARWTVRARVSQKADIRRYSNQRGEGKVSRCLAFGCCKTLSKPWSTGKLYLLLSLHAGTTGPAAAAQLLACLLRCLCKHCSHSDRPGSA